MSDPAASAKDQVRQLLLEKYEPIAIVGVGLRLPGDNNTLDGFADFLAGGRCGIVPIPAERWDVAALAGDGDRPGRVRTTGGGFISGLDQFDARFFNISPKEAQYVDPQQRLILETAWEALENANIDPTGLRHGDGGVFMGIGSMDYLLELAALDREELAGPLGTGTAHSAASGRLSYFLGWRGPCLSVDTACSSSLVAVHLAAQALRRGECGIALAGGVNAIHHPTTSIVFSAADMLAPDGLCKTFDDSADGYSRGEGCGVLVLKRLSTARRDGDRILALIRGSAVRQDGESAGLTVPNGTAQEAVMRAALTSAALGPADISYVEAHGTGTPLGDPIEMGSINDVFAGSRDPDDPVVVGSVKTNLGHLEIAAGVAGIIKVVLQLQHRTIYPHVNLRTPSRRIPWDRYPVLVPTDCRPWPGEPRRAIVNSFGFTGTIATVVLEQAPPGVAAEVPHPAASGAGAGGAGGADDGASENEGEGENGADGGHGHVFALSAKTRTALREQARRYRRHLAAHPELAVAQVCRTSTLGRAHFPVRLAALVRDRGELLDLLERQIASADDPPSAPAGETRKVAFLFTGQGAQYPGMGRALYAQHAAFRDHVDECDRLFTPHLGRSLRQLMLGESDDPESIHRTGYAQPALFTLEYAAARLWLSWGVRPSVLLGHSIGEIAAAAVAGLFRLDDAVRLVAARARVMQAVTEPGGMVAVTADVTLVGPLLESWPQLSVAAVNAPGRCVVSGGRAQLDAFVAELGERGIPVRELRVSHAFHSPLMAPAAQAFRTALDGITFREPTLTLVSALTGQVARPAEIGTVDYWVRHLREPVDFAAGMRTVQRRGRHAFVEVGPAPTLTALGKLCVEADQQLWLSTTDHRDIRGDAIRRSVARLYAAGLPVSWAGYHGDRTAPMATLPGYAFTRRRYWLPITAGPGTSRVAGGPVQHPLLGAETTTASERAGGIRAFAAEISAGAPGYLADHRAMGATVFPLAGYLETLFALQAAVYGETDRPIEELTVHEPLLLDGDEPVRLQTRLTPGPDGAAHVELSSRDGRRHLTATIRPTGATGAAAEIAGLAADLAAAGAAADLAATAGTIPADRLYAAFRDLGLEYGPQFQRLHQVVHHTDLAVGELAATDTAPLEHLPPPVLDAALQTVMALSGRTDAHLPVRIGSCRLFKKPMAGALRSVLRLRPAEPDPVADAPAAADAVLLEGDRPIFALRGLGYRRVGGSRVPGRRLLHEPRWIRQALDRPDPTGAGTRHLVTVHARPDLIAGLAAQVRVTATGSAAEAAAALAQRPTDLCWFWRAEPGPPGVERLRAECERNYRDLLELLRLLPAAKANANASADVGAGPRLWLVTEGAQPLPGDPAGDGTSLAAASLWGLGRVFGNEHPAHRCTLIDLTPGASEHRALLAEILAATPDELQVAYRDGQRHVRRLQPVDEPDAEPSPPATGRNPSPPTVTPDPSPPTVTPDPSPPIDGLTVAPDETYLITGGRGGLGRALARRLVALGARHLTLVGRGATAGAARGRPDGVDSLDSVDGLDDPDHRGGLADFRDLGAEVTIDLVDADIGDPADVARLTERLLSAGRPVGGIVHAAGVLADAPLAGQSWETFDRVFRAKVYGSWLLHEAAGRLPGLRFFVGYSSIAALLGPPGQANYAAGNAYLDALLCWRAGAGAPGFAVNWGPWAEAGMAAGLGSAAARAIEARGVRLLPTATALDGLSRALATPGPQVLVGEFDWGAVAGAAALPDALYRAVAPAGAGPAHRLDLAALRAQPPVRRIEAVDAHIRATIAQVLQFDSADEVESDSEFVSLGLDSLAAVALRNSLEAAFQVSLPASITFDHPSVRLLARYLDRQLAPPVPAGVGEEHEMSERSGAAA